jgi:hypothetical protein
MAKCRYCGAESHSSLDCPFLRDFRAKEPSDRGENLRFNLQLASMLVILLLGTALTIGGSLKATLESSQEERADWEHLALFGLSMMSSALGVLIYYLAGARPPLWMVREGRRSRNRLAVVLMSFGVMAATLEIGHLILSATLDRPAGSGAAHSLVLLVTILAVVAGYLERPASVLGVDRRKPTTRRTRIATGISLLLAGILIPAVTPAYLSSQDTSPYMVVVLVQWAVLFGLVLGAGGLGIIFPSGRWWVSEGLIKER